ncbi:MAG: GGDEF domain-containing protein [Myxococcota bacterium]|nr:GGDEF domain-containing protein [Myxococcota bacterium]
MDPSERDTLKMRMLPPDEETAAAAGDACLVVIYGPSLGRKLALDRSEIQIGRDARCDLVIPLETVSRRHCRIAQTEGRPALQDLGSTNGTWLNDELLAPGESLPLRSGDLLRIGSAIFKFLEGDNVEAQYHEEVYRTMIVDGLTKAYNRRYLTEFLEREMSRCRRHDRPLALMLFDLDHFKRVNDEYGHLAGDAVLREVALLVRGRVRRDECLARFGGEEFAIVMPETDLDSARQFAERLRALVAQHPFVVGDQQVLVTISAGIADLTKEIEDSARFLAEADARLYDAKRAGRNRVVG